VEEAKGMGMGWESAADWLAGYLLVMLRQKSECTMQRCAKSCQACSTSASVRKSDSDSDVDDTPLGILRDERYSVCGDEALIIGRSDSCWSWREVKLKLKLKLV